MLKLGAVLDALAIIIMCAMLYTGITNGRTAGAPIYVIIIALLIAGFVYLVKRIKSR